MYKRYHWTILLGGIAFLSFLLIALDPWNTGSREVNSLGQRSGKSVTTRYGKSESEAGLRNVTRLSPQELARFSEDYRQVEEQIIDNGVPGLLFRRTSLFKSFCESASRDFDLQEHLWDEAKSLGNRFDPMLRVIMPLERVFQTKESEREWNSLVQFSDPRNLSEAQILADQLWLASNTRGARVEAAVRLLGSQYQSDPMVISSLMRVLQGDAEPWLRSAVLEEWSMLGNFSNVPRVEIATATLTALRSWTEPGPRAAAMMFSASLLKNRIESSGSADSQELEVLFMTNIKSRANESEGQDHEAYAAYYALMERDPTRSPFIEELLAIAEDRGETEVVRARALDLIAPRVFSSYPSGAPDRTEDYRARAAAVLVREYSVDWPSRVKAGWFSSMGRLGNASCVESVQRIAQLDPSSSERVARCVELIGNR